MNRVFARAHTPPTPPSGAQVPAGAEGLRVRDNTSAAVLTLADAGGAVPFPNRLRRFLKTALRCHGLTCIDVRQIQSPSV